MNVGSKELISQLDKQEQRLRELIIYLEKRQERRIPGSLQVSYIRKRPRYYHYFRDPESGKQIRKYLQKNESRIIQILAQQEYEKRLLAAAKHKLDKMGGIKSGLEDDSLERVYTEMNEALKPLIQPIIPDTESFVRQWETQPYSAGQFQEDAPVILTIKGERVRSKTEKIIGDCYCQRKIPYRYECPITLDVNGKRVVFRPDFTLLHIACRKVIYHEHFGMMDDPEYCGKALRKIEIYAANGIYAGDNLIITGETKEHPINMQYLNRLIDKYFF